MNFEKMFNENGIIIILAIFFLLFIFVILISKII